MSEQEKKELETSEDAVEEAAAESNQEPQAASAKDTKAVTAKKSGKPAKKSKPSVFARIGKWFHDLRVEAKKVVWPTKKQVVNNTLIVIVCIIVVCVVVTLFDVTFGSIRDFIARLA